MRKRSFQINNNRKIYKSFIYSLQLFRNDDVNPKKSIKKKKFLKEETITEVSKWIEEELRWEDEFDNLDGDKDGKISFEDFIRFDLKDNSLIDNNSMIQVGFQEEYES